MIGGDCRMYSESKFILKIGIIVIMGILLQCMFFVIMGNVYVRFRQYS